MCGSGDRCTCITGIPPVDELYKEHGCRHHMTGGGGKQT